MKKLVEVEMTSEEILNFELAGIRRAIDTLIGRTFDIEQLLLKTIEGTVDENTLAKARVIFNRGKNNEK